MGWRRGGRDGLVSAAALAAAYLLTVAPHELVHALVAASSGLDPVWHADRAPHAAGSADREALVAVAGPVYSLASGCLALLLGRRDRRRPGLLSTWFGVLGVAGFCGYLVSGPFAAAGDVADALRLSRAPTWLGWVGAAVGVAGLLVTARVAAVRLPLLAPAAWSPRRAVAVVGLLALPPAAVLVVLAGIPVGPPLIAQFTVLAVTLLGGLVVARRPAPDGGRALASRPWAPVAVLLVLAAVDWLVLRPGVPL